MLQSPQGTAILDRVQKIPIFHTLRMRVDELGEGFCRQRSRMIADSTGCTSHSTAGCS